MKRDGKIAGFVAELDSHEIYNHDDIAAGFKKATGLEPCWPVHSAKRAEADIHKRGVRGWVKNGLKRVAYGYEVAEALAEGFTASTDHRRFRGLGSRFRAALKALKDAGA